MDQAVRRVGGHDTIEDTTAFTDALVRLREETASTSSSTTRSPSPRTRCSRPAFDMPANLVEGDYAAQFFLVRDREVISTGATTIRVEKTGIERWLYNLSRNRPLLYGLASVAAALAAGWLAAEAFRLARR